MQAIKLTKEALQGLVKCGRVQVRSSPFYQMSLLPRKTYSSVPILSDPDQGKLAQEAVQVENSKSEEAKKPEQAQENADGSQRKRGKNKNRNSNQQTQNQGKGKSKAAEFNLAAATANWGAHNIFDIAANMSDDRYEGKYYGKQCHEPDFDKCIERANMFGVHKFLFAAGYLEDARISLDLSNRSEHFFATIGIHPCRALEPYKERLPKKATDGTVLPPDERKVLLDSYFEKIDQFIEAAPSGKIVAIGECGLDYDRFEFADKQCQLEAFEPHFKLTEKYNLPMYLHSRATGNDFVDIIRENRSRFPTGVVHSFTGTLEEMNQICELDLFIGINGCSMKTEENCEVVRQIPIERMMIETDCPYCDIRNSHHSSQHVKTVFPRKPKDKYDPQSTDFYVVRDRNEPCTIVQVVEVIAALKGMSTQEVAQVAYANTMRMFQLS